MYRYTFKVEVSGSTRVIDIDSEKDDLREVYHKLFDEIFDKQKIQIGLESIYLDKVEEISSLEFISSKSLKNISNVDCSKFKRIDNWRNLYLISDKSYVPVYLKICKPINAGLDYHRYSIYIGRIKANFDVNTSLWSAEIFIDGIYRSLDCSTICAISNLLIAEYRNIQEFRSGNTIITDVTTDMMMNSF